MKNTATILRLQEKLKQENFDGMLLGTGANMQYLLEEPKLRWQREGGDEPDTENERYQTDMLLYVPAEGEAVLIATAYRAQQMKDLGYEVIPAVQLGFDMALRHFLTGSRIAVGRLYQHHLKAVLAACDSRIETEDGETIVQKMRYIKTPAEIETMREGAAFVDWVLEQTVPMLRPGVTYAQVEKFLMDIGLENGCEDLSFRHTVRFEKGGTDFSITFTMHDDNTYFHRDKPLEEGSSISFDFGYVRNGYCSDFGRSFYCGKAPEVVKRAWEVLIDAQELLINTMRPYETNAKDMYGVIAKYVWDHGYGPQLLNHNNVGTLAHNIGIDVHENPWVHNNADFLLEPGMIMCIEPKILVPRECFLRVEDMVLVTETGAESLTKFDRRKFFELPV